MFETELYTDKVDIDTLYLTENEEKDKETSEKLLRWFRYGP